MKTLHSALRVRNLDRSLDFYRKVGFREIGRVKLGDDSILVMLKLPGDGDVVTLERSTSLDSDASRWATASGTSWYRWPTSTQPWPI
jgi:catechol 2,3-dioxygenase-like lactoylglutathione lyase family enzyme